MTVILDDTASPARQFDLRLGVGAALVLVLQGANPGLAAEAAIPAGSVDPDVCRQPHDLDLQQLKRIDDPMLVRAATGEEGQGNLCQAVAYEVRHRITVYRLSSSPVVQLDRWWTFTEPSGTAEQYRKDNVMCDAWSTRKKTTCQLQVGTHIAVGFGQSHLCSGSGDRPFAASPKWQIYLLPDQQGRFETQAVDCAVGEGLE